MKIEILKIAKHKQKHWWWIPDVENIDVTVRIDDNEEMTVAMYEHRPGWVMDSEDSKKAFLRRIANKIIHGDEFYHLHKLPTELEGESITTK